MRINLPSKIRAIIYVITALGTPVVNVLTGEGFLPDWAMTLWVGEVAAVTAMAALNVSNPEK